MATQNNKKDGFGESVINWLVSIYPTLSKNTYKTRKCKI